MCRKLQGKTSIYEFGEINMQKDPTTSSVQFDQLSRLEELRERDREIASIAMSLGFKKRIDELEKENAYLRVQAEAYTRWRESTTFKLARSITYLLGPFGRSSRAIRALKK